MSGPWKPARNQLPHFHCYLYYTVTEHTIHHLAYKTKICGRMPPIYYFTLTRENESISKV
jgi:hypothetical protein